MNIKQCVFCDNTNTLNTQMSINDNGQMISVFICDEHAEDATIKSAKEAYSAKKDKIQALLEQAKALGLNISETSSGLSIVQEQKQSVSVPRVVSSELDVNDPNVVPTAKLNVNRPIASVGGEVSGHSVQSHTSFDMSSLSEKLPEEVLNGHAEMAMVEGRSGQPLVIPKTRVDGTGTTRITIQKTDDNILQNRFKKMANDSMNGNTPDFARAGYQNTTANCPVCRGNGTVKNAGKNTVCPKCTGTGLISIY